MEKKAKKFDLRSLLRSDTNLTRLLIIFAISFVTMAILKPGIFLTKDYIVSMVYIFPEYGILAFAMMLAMISGGIDLSVVATANLSGILSCLFLINFMPQNPSAFVSALFLIAVVVLAMCIGALCGALNGLLIGKLGIPPMLATLGSSDLIMGLSLAITKGSSLTGIPDVLSKVTNTVIFGFIPVTLLVFIACAIVVSFALSKTTFGFRMQMMGSNPTASRFSGVKNSSILMKTYMLGGMLASVSGLLMCGRANSARANFGTSYVMQTIIICVLGGTNPNGGFGRTSGIAIAVLILQVLSSGFNMFPGISNFYRDLIWGVVLILVMAYNHISNKRKEKKMSKAL